MEPSLVRIPEGWFWMGSDSGQGGQDNERPVHRVWVDAFFLAACQVRNSEYGEFLLAMETAPPPFWHDPNLNRPDQPVVGVSWHEASSYCQWLSSGSGRRFRLPTEAEWERAARGGVDNRLYPWGDAFPQSLPDYEKRWRNGPEPVAQYAANPFGLYDICENVHEWCSRLVSGRLLFSFTGTKSHRPRARYPARVSRRLLASPH